MKYGEIKWKNETVVFKLNGGIVKRTSEVDEGRTFIRKVSDHGDMPIKYKNAPARNR